MGMLYKFKRKFQKKWKAYRESLVSPNKKAIWIFGMQKAGTSAIAGILAHRTGKTVTIDTPYLWHPYLNQIKSGEISFTKHIKKNSYPFSKDIIKEPAASLLIEEVDDYFYLDKYLFIIRNPFDLIRSILNRLNLSGSETSLKIENVHKNWRYMFQDGENHVQKLAEIYRKIYSQDKYIQNQHCILVKYEDFKSNKELFIDELCDQLDLPKINSIESIKNKNFQPKGQPITNYKSFFGEENYNIIHKIAYPIASSYGYSISEL